MHCTCPCPLGSDTVKSCRFGEVLPVLTLIRQGGVGEHGALGYCLGLSRLRMASYVLQVRLNILLQRIEKAYPSERVRPTQLQCGITVGFLHVTGACLKTLKYLITNCRQNEFSF
jgi:hypothetical protein